MAAAKVDPSSGRMKLAAAVTGRLVKPMRVLVYGIEGVGKSSFAAAAPSPIFLGAEDGTSELDVARFPEPQSWRDALDAITELTTAPHEYKTLVIDTLDWLEPACWTRVFQGRKDKAGKAYESIEDIGYGKGYNAALDHWRVLLVMLERLRTTRGMHIIPIAHSWVKTFKNPAGEDYDRYEMKLHAKAAGIWREWCDAVLFAAHETYTYESDSGRVKGISNGARVLHTERCAAWDAKNRYDLPPTLPLDWTSFAEAVAAHRPADPAVLRARIDELLATQTDDIKARVTAAVEAAAGNAAELARIHNTLAAMAGTNEEEAAS
jgi:hypothetical protein